MLGEPAFFGGLVNSQSQGEFFQAYGIAAVLSINAVDQVILKVNIDAAFVDIFADTIFHLAFAVDEPEKIFRWADFFKLLISTSIKNCFAVSDIR